jgi:hypothetical protein
MSEFLRGLRSLWVEVATFWLVVWLLYWLVSGLQ